MEISSGVEGGDRVRLRELIVQAGFTSIQGFASAAGVGRQTLYRIEKNELATVRIGSIERVAAALGRSLGELLTDLGLLKASSGWQQEYERLVGQQSLQEATLREQWDRQFFSALELLLLQLPTVRVASAANPELSAAALLDLLLPLDAYLERSGFESIGKPGDSVPFDPQLHQGLGIPAGHLVRVRTVGYRYKGALLVRARVMPA